MENWGYWEYRRPLMVVLIQIWREGWDTPVTTTRENVAPEMDVSGLRWRLTGIGREQIDAMGTEQLAQLERDGTMTICGYGENAVPTFWSLMGQGAL